MTPQPNPRELIYTLLFCAHCGNRVPLIVVLDRHKLDSLSDEVAPMRCVDCNGPMDVKELSVTDDARVTPRR